MIIRFIHRALASAAPLLFCGLAISTAQAEGHEHTGPGLHFLENKGQVRDAQGEACPEVNFVAQAAGCRVFVSPTGLSYQFERPQYPEGYREQLSRQRLGKAPSQPTPHFPVHTHRVDMRLMGANPAATAVPEGLAAYREHYYNVAVVPAGITDVRAYEAVRFRAVYPGIDWVLRGKAQGIKYDFIVQPGADPALIQMDYQWADALYLDDDGALVISTALGSLRESAPLCYQGAQRIQARFVLEGQRVGIAVGPYDPSRPLVIDPDVLWASYYGGTSDDLGFAVCTDAADGVYLAGSTASSNNIANGGQQNNLGGNLDAFVVKLDRAGNRLWATYYGGENEEIPHALNADATGNIYLAGQTESPSNIAANGHQGSFGGLRDGFLVKFSAAGMRQWGTYYGGDQFEEAQGVATDHTGSVYLTGWTSSFANISANGHQAAFAGVRDAFLAKFDTNGARLWATYYGGTNDDLAFSVATSAAGEVYIAGETISSTGGIFAAGHQATFGGLRDAFVAKFDSNGTRLWGTYYGGNQDDAGYALAVGSTGDLYLYGRTFSDNSIATAGSYQVEKAGGFDAFLVKFDPAGTRLWGTYHGGESEDLAEGIAPDSQGGIYVVGWTNSLSGIASDSAWQATLNGSFDAFWAQFDAQGERVYATYYGGPDFDIGSGIAVDTAGQVYIVGATVSSTGIATANGFQASLAGESDAFIVRFGEDNMVSAQRPWRAIARASVFPVPAQGIIHIQCAQPLSAAALVRVYAADGRLCLQQASPAASGLLSLDVRGLAPGAYTVQVQDGPAAYVGRFVKL